MTTAQRELGPHVLARLRLDVDDHGAVVAAAGVRGEDAGHGLERLEDGVASPRASTRMVPAPFRRRVRLSGVSSATTVPG